MKWRHDIDGAGPRDEARIKWLIDRVYPLLKRYHRAEVRGIDRIPDGPALYVGNHNAGVMIPDTYIFCAEVYKKKGLDGLPYGLGHEILMQVPGINHVLIPIGARRASHQNGEAIFEAGHKALVYPGSDIDTFRPHRLRNRICFGDRKGYLRLAIRSNVPIQPVVAAGAHGTFYVIHDFQGLAKLLKADRWLRSKVWPLAISLPWGLTFGPTPPFLPLPRRILIEILPPIHFSRTGEAAAADEVYLSDCKSWVELNMQRALDRLAMELSA